MIEAIVRMKNKKNQKKLELEEGTRFLRLANIKYDELNPFQNEPPDLILKIGDKAVGIEHSILMTEDGARMIPISKTYDEVIIGAKKLYEKQRLQPLNVYVSFREPINISGGKKGKAISELLDLIIKSMNSIENGGSFEIKENELLPYTSEIRISKNRYGQNNWQRQDSFWAGPLSGAHLISKIVEKDKLVKKNDQLEKFSEIWLLLIVKGTEWSEFSLYNPIDFIWNPSWCFKKIFLYGVFADEVREVTSEIK